MADRRPAPVTLHRFFLPPDAMDGDGVVFPAEQSHQIRRVLRLQPGDQVIALDGTGAEFTVRLDMTPNDVTGAVEERRWNSAEPRARVVLYQGLLKGAKLELVLQKGTEIGVAEFVPVLTARSIPGDISPARQRRYEAIIREAAEQSRRGTLPPLSPMQSFDVALETASVAGPILLAFEDADGAGLCDMVRADWTRCSLFVGPEGGFSTDEVEQARALGAHIVTLGPRILRAETAAIVSAALALGTLGELGS